MYISTLLVNVGVNPDRPRPGRLWLRNPYRVHQRLCMAFPMQQRKTDDPLFLRPYKPEDFAVNQVFVERQTDAGFLFRIDPVPGGSPMILVQSAILPDWDYAFHNAPYLLLTKPEVRQYNPQFQAGKSYKFRILINLSKKIKKSSDGTDLQKYKNETDAFGRQKAQSKRVSLIWDKNADPTPIIRDWFIQKTRVKSSNSNQLIDPFELQEFRVLNTGWIRAWKEKSVTESEEPDIESDLEKTVEQQKTRTIQLRSALLEGTLIVKDPDAMLRLVVSGVGAGKAFGFGLLTVIPKL